MMKNKDLLFGMLLMAMVGLGFVPRAEVGEAPSRTISVSGEALVKVIPDEVRLTLGIETWHRELAVAKNRNDERLSEVIKLARRHGINLREIQTDYINIEPRYQDTYERTIVEGYFVRKTLVVTLHELDHFDAFLTDVTEAGITHVHGIQFRTTELRKYRDQARALATEAALEKATDMAAVLGAKIGLPQTVREEQVGWYSWYGYGWWGSRYGFASQNVVQTVDGPAMEMDSTLAPGQISVSARVSVSFDLLP